VFTINNDRLPFHPAISVLTIYIM